MAEKRVNVRIAAIGGKRVRAEFQGIGRDGSRSFSLVDREVANLNRRLGRLGKGSGQARGNLRNLSLQLSQVAQQGSVTGDYMRALAIQIPDMAIGFGTLGIAIGALGAVLGPVAIDFLRAADAGETLSEKLEGVASSVSEYRDLVKQAAAPTEDLIEKYGAFAGKARELLAAQRDLAKLNALKQISAAIVASREAIGDLGDASAAQLASAARQVDEIRARIEDLREEQRALTSQGLGVGQNAARNIQIGAEISDLQSRLLSLSQSLGPIREIEEKFGITTEKAIGLAEAIDRVADARGIEAQAEAAEAMRIAFIDALGGIENITDESRGLLEQLTESSIATMAFRSAMDDAEGATTAAASAGNDLADAISGASKSTEGLVSGLFDALGSLVKARKIAADISRMAAAGNAGRGGDPRKSGGSFADWKIVTEFGWQDPYSVSRAPAASGASSSRARQIASIESEKNAFERLKASVDGAFAAKLRLAEADETLSAAIKAGLVDKDQAAQIMDRLRQQIEDTSSETSEFYDTMKGGVLDAITGIQSLGDVFDNLAERIKRAAFEALLFNEGMFQVEGRGKGLLGGILGSIGGFLTNGISAEIHHSGGIAGRSTYKRQVNPEIFAGALRTGLGPNEVPAILQRGERVIPVGASSNQVDVRVFVDQDGNWQAAVERISAGVAARAADRSILEYDRNSLPRRVDQIRRMPRVIG